MADIRQALELILRQHEPFGAVARVSREASATDERAAALLQELLATPGGPADWREPDIDTPLSLVMPVEVRRGDFGG